RVAATRGFARGALPSQSLGSRRHGFLRDAPCSGRCSGWDCCGPGGAAGRTCFAGSSPGGSAPRSCSPTAGTPAAPPPALRPPTPADTARFASGLVSLILAQQFLLIALVTPAFAAGAITDEKTRGTLQSLLTAHLTPAAIVLGKLFARAVQVGVL